MLLVGKVGKSLFSTSFSFFFLIDLYAVYLHEVHHVRLTGNSKHFATDMCLLSNISKGRG